MTNPNVMNIREVAQYFGVSQKTIRRRVADRKNGIGSFPLAIFDCTQKSIWYRSEIEGWKETPAVPMAMRAEDFTPDF